MGKPTRSEGKPHDRLTRICEAMCDAMDAHPERHSDDKAIVFLTSTKKGGIQLHGWDDDIDAMAALLTHLQAIFEANGKSLEIIAVPDDASGLTKE